MTTSTSALTLKTVFNVNNPALEPLRDGSVTIEGVQMDQIYSPNIIAAFRTMCRTLEYDISEMAVVTYFAARHYGLPMTAIPVMASARVHQGNGIQYNTRIVSSPRELEGKRVGLRAYTVTPATWQRAYLASQGVDLSKISWVSATEEHLDSYHADKVPNLEYDLSADLAALLRSGAIAAGFNVPGVEDDPDIKEFWPDSRDIGIEAFKKDGTRQLIHLIVVKTTVLEQYPWVLKNAYDAFKESKRLWNERRDRSQPLEDYDDPLPLGMSELRGSLQKLMDHSVAQGILPKPLDLDDIFPGAFD